MFDVDEAIQALELHKIAGYDIDDKMCEFIIELLERCKE